MWRGAALAMALAGWLHATPPTLTHVEGRVMLRSAERARVEFPKNGRELTELDALITGEQARFEVKVGEAGLWRVGRRAVFHARTDGGTLSAGTALVRVPTDAGWRVDAARGAVLLGKGLWMLQAVENEGLKVICLDGPAHAEALATAGSEKTNTTLTRVELRPGELVFLRPGDAGFGPIVTIYLEELLGTSRLVNAFPEPLAETPRLRNLGFAQRERLKGVSNALVGEARDETGFEIAVPKRR